MAEFIWVIVGIPFGCLVAYFLGAMQEDDPCAGGPAIILPMFGPIFGAIILAGMINTGWIAISAGILYGLAGSVLCIPAFMRGKHPPKSPR